MSVAKNISNNEISLKSFLENWDKEYVSKVQNIEMFNDEWVKTWSVEQKQFFVKVFYHLRGHFHEFLWFLANHAQDKETKDIVLNNIAEELNGSAASHEIMYFHFAESLGVDMMKECISEEYYLDFAKEFNKGHVRWLAEHDHEERICAFGAYERLDNVDYNSLYKFASNLGTTNKGLIFFKIHTLVEHFETTESKLEKIWERTPEKVIAGFDFIASHQLAMWNTLSNAIKSLEK